MANDRATNIAILLRPIARSSRMEGLMPKSRFLIAGAILLLQIGGATAQPNLREAVCAPPPTTLVRQKKDLRCVRCKCGCHCHGQGAYVTCTCAKCEKAP